METQKPSMSPLRQRMIDDMRMRKFGEKTQLDYIRAVRNFTKYLGRSPDTAAVEDLRNYQLHLVDQGVSPASLNSAISGLKFFFNVTLDRPELVAKMQPVHLPRKLPVILSPEEVKRLIAAAGNLKHQTALALAYAIGLRVNEVAVLKVGDIDSQRMTLRVEQDKKAIYRLLFDVAAETLLTIAADSKHLGARIGATLVLHPAQTTDPGTTMMAVPVLYLHVRKSPSSASGIPMPRADGCRLLPDRPNLPIQAPPSATTSAGINANSLRPAEHQSLATTFITVELGIKSP